MENLTAAELRRQRENIGHRLTSEEMSQAERTRLREKIVAINEELARRAA